MFLEQVLEWIRRHGWTALVVEFLLLVLGVFVGLEASNWNESRIERDLERSYLVRLYRDLEASAERTRVREANYLAKQAREQHLARAIVTCDFEEEDLRDHEIALNTLGIVSNPAFVEQAYLELATSGRLSLLRNIELAAALADVAAHVEYVEALQQSISRIVQAHRSEVDAHVFFDTGRPLPHEIGWLAEVEFDPEALCARPELGNRISSAALLTGERATHFGKLAERFERVLPLIEADLRARWGIDVALVPADAQAEG